MAEYRDIQGAAVQSRTGNTGLIEGEIWYKSDSGVFKLETVTTAAWASSGNLPQTGDERVGIGIQTAALSVARQNQGYQTFADCDTYDGATWTSSPNINTSRTGGFASREGSTTAGVYAGGFNHTPSSPTMGNTQE